MFVLTETVDPYLAMTVEFKCCLQSGSGGALAVQHCTAAPACGRDQPVGGWANQKLPITAEPK